MSGAATVRHGQVRRRLASILPASTTNPPNCTRDQPVRPRRGAAAVEFALVAPLFFLFVLGIVEFGRAMTVQQIITNASREGSRRAIIDGATPNEVETLVSSYLANAQVGGATVAITPGAFDVLNFGDPITVEVSVPYDQVSLLGTSRFLGGRTLTARTEMRAERIQ